MAESDLSPGPAAGEGGGGRLPQGAWLVVGLLFLACVLNFVDRSIMNILADPISKELHLSDTQIGLMTGLAFTLLYSIVGLPLAGLIDRARTDRVRLLAVCLALWSSMTAVCGMATSYGTMLAARVGVGVGEAGCTPAGHSLISDIVPPEKRSSALAFYGMGVPAGSLLGLAVGGLLADTIGWRNAFLVAGAPGLILALLIWWFMKDPRKVVLPDGRPLAVEADVEQAPRMWAAFREIMSSRAFVWLLVGGGALAFLNYGRGTWNVIYFIRAFGLSPGQVGLALGLTGGIAGMFGAWLGGLVADRMGPKKPQHYLTVAVLAYALAVPLYMLAYCAPTWPMALTLLFLPQMLDSMSYGPSFAAIQGVARPRTRGVAVVLKLFVQSLIGGGLGPLLLGVVSDQLKAGSGNNSIRIVLFGASLLGLLVAFAYWRASLRLGSELRHLRA